MPLNESGEQKFDVKKGGLGLERAGEYFKGLLLPESNRLSKTVLHTRQSVLLLLAFLMSCQAPGAISKKDFSEVGDLSREQLVALLDYNRQNTGTLTDFVSPGAVVSRLEQGQLMYSFSVDEEESGGSDGNDEKTGGEEMVAQTELSVRSEEAGMTSATTADMDESSVRSEETEKSQESIDGEDESEGTEKEESYQVADAKTMTDGNAVSTEKIVSRGVNIFSQDIKDTSAPVEEPKNGVGDDQNNIVAQLDDRYEGKRQQGTIPIVGGSGSDRSGGSGITQEDLDVVIRNSGFYAFDRALDGRCLADQDNDGVCDKEESLLEDCSVDMKNDLTVQHVRLLQHKWKKKGLNDEQIKSATDSFLLPYLSHDEKLKMEDLWRFQEILGKFTGKLNSYINEHYEKGMELIEDSVEITELEGGKISISFNMEIFTENFHTRYYLIESGEDVTDNFRKYNQDELMSQSSPVIKIMSLSAIGDDYDEAIKNAFSAYEKNIKAKSKKK